MTETRTQFWQRRHHALRKMTKADLCRLYRSLGGLGGIHPPEFWTKDEVATSVVDIEWDRLPDDQKVPEPTLMSPPCDQCGKGEGARAHAYGGSHHYRYTSDPSKPWVPYYENCATCGRSREDHETWSLSHSYQAPEEEPTTAARSGTAWGVHRPEDPFPTAYGPVQLCTVCHKAPEDAAHGPDGDGHVYRRPAEGQPAESADATAPQPAPLFRQSGPMLAPPPAEATVSAPMGGYLQAFREVTCVSSDVNPANDPITPDEHLVTGYPFPINPPAIPGRYRDTSSSGPYVDGPGCTPAVVPNESGELVRAGSLYADKCAECTTGVSCEDARRCLFEG